MMVVDAAFLFEISVFPHKKGVILSIPPVVSNWWDEETCRAVEPHSWKIRKKKSKWMVRDYHFHMLIKNFFLHSMKIAVGLPVFTTHFSEKV